jgi:asparaginyl-tRNA synthetase
MRDHDFIKIDAPIFTPAACEGTTELYEVEHVNGETMYLSQSGQLYIEAAIAAHGRVFDFGPVFRAEKSKTRRHLNEFWMMDAEMAFVSFEENLQIQEDLIFYIVQEVLAKHKDDLALLERNTAPLEALKKPFIRWTHSHYVEELMKA